jgi:hypothetical protein
LQGTPRQIGHYLTQAAPFAQGDALGGEQYVIIDAEGSAHGGLQIAEGRGLEAIRESRKEELILELALRHLFWHRLGKARFQRPVQVPPDGRSRQAKAAADGRSRQPFGRQSEYFSNHAHG